MLKACFHNRGPWALFAALLVPCAALHAGIADDLGALAPGGSLALTSNFIYRGVSESDGHGAVQGDVHLASRGGTFLGIWASTRDPDIEPEASAVLDLYLGHRFALSSTWSATLSGRTHSYLGASRYEPSDDYQQIIASLTYLDGWSISITAIPNAVHWWFYTRLGRDPAWVADTSGQYLLGRGVFLTAGAGYYRTQGTGSGMERATGYAYGNAGLAWEHGPWRLDVGYFLTQEAAQRLYPYPVDPHKVAGTLSWQF